MRLLTVLRLCVLPLTFLTLSSPAQSPFTPYDYVDPFIGTDGGGNTFPGATLPFGMVQWSPDTNTEAWYRHGESQIYGFSLTHISGAGCPLYGDFAVLPTTETLAAAPGAHLAPVAFNHRDEEAHPGYYTAKLANGVRVELTVTERAGIALFNYPQGAPMRVLVNAGGSANSTPGKDDKPHDHDAFGNHIEIKPDGSFSGWVSAGRFCSSDSHYKLYVAGKFDRPIKSARVWQDDSILSDSKSAQGKHTGAWLDFGVSDEREAAKPATPSLLVLRVGISFVSEAGALANLEREIPGTGTGWNRALDQARKRWSELLSRFTVEGGTDDQRKIFYTGVYHSFLSPNLFSDEDGQYIGFDGKLHNVSEARQKAQYANFSDWDIYRNTVQLQALFDPQRESDMMQSLVNDAVQSGWYPRWPAANDVTYVMGGDSPVALLASSWAFGARSFDAETALKFMIKAGTQPGKGPHNGEERPFLAEYLKNGYSPIDKDHIAASRTLEYASDDFAIAQFARNIGHDAEYKAFLKQSENWKNLIDPETHWIRPKAGDGTWLPDFDTERSLPKRVGWPGTTDQEGFEEGNTWQYSFMVPFDYPALFAAMGGEAVAEQRLDRFFTALRCWGKPCFNIENEPDFVTPYAYAFLGKPWKTQEVVTRIGKETFKTTPDGIPGNDDLGATSGVYVWNALGFYPAVPGVGGFVMGTPMFDRTTLRLAGDRTLVVSKSGGGIYVDGASLDGAPYKSVWLPLEKIHAGTTHLEFRMSTEPNKQRGSAADDRPPLFR